MRLNYIDCIDCLEGLKEIPDNSVDLVVTDPPYGIGIKSQGGAKGGGAKLNPWADICNASLWYTAWMKECKRVLKDDGALWSFINWRYFPTLCKAGLDAQWSVESLLVWDKCWIGPGGLKGLRPSYEQVALFTMPGFAIKDRSLADIQRFKWGSYKPTGHPAEKPVDLIRWIIQASGKTDGAVILDPFMGSGTTGVSAVREGCSYIGFDMDADWVRKAEERIAAETPAAEEVAAAIEEEDWLA
jgi:site-specific DNA-methyltransferase (adenine-specific)